MSRRGTSGIFLGAVLAIAGCNGSGGGGGGGAKGTVEPPWDAYCTLTFTKNHKVIDAFDDVALSARAGETYLLGGFTKFGGKTKTTFFVLTSDGPVDLDLEVAEGETPPFETNCNDGETRSYLGVYRETVVYQDEGLSEEVCTLPANTIVESEFGGYSLASDLSFDESEPLIYQYTLAALGEQKCGGVTSGYVQADYAHLAGTTYDSLPIFRFSGPKE
jgi:hypothetical protein